METLRNVKCGQSVRVVKLHGEGAVKRRIMDMGMTQGHRCLCEKSSALRRSGRSDGERL